MAKISIRGLTKRYDTVVAVDKLDLEIADGEYVALLGPSGCGKTTTLRCIAGLVVADEGQIFIGDQLVNNLPPRERDVALVFQNYALYPHMTVFGNLAFPLRLRKHAEHEIAKRVEETARLLKIEEVLERKPKQLSGGQQQRVALGRAIIRKPKAFLMDEPLSNLDAKLRMYMRAELKRLQKELGITTVYVTHDQMEAMTMADRIAVMDKGLLQQFAQPEQVYNSPATISVAGFIGSPPMNFIEGKLVRSDGGVVLETTNFNYQFSGGLSLHLERAGPQVLVFGVRPEHIGLSREMTANTSVEGSVYVTEPLGREVIVDVSVGNQIIKAVTSSEFKVAMGDKVWVGFDESKVRLFDKATGKTLMRTH